jgi:hypothetical protein
MGVKEQRHALAVLLPEKKNCWRSLNERTDGALEEI